MNQIIDYPALLLAVLIAVAVSVALMKAHEGDNHRRGWIVAGIVAAALIGIGFIDLMAAPRREIPIATVIVGPGSSVVAVVGMIRATRRVRPWVRWLMVFVTALLFFFGGLFVGATLPS